MKMNNLSLYQNAYAAAKRDFAAKNQTVAQIMNAQDLKDDATDAEVDAYCNAYEDCSDLHGLTAARAAANDAEKALLEAFRAQVETVANPAQQAELTPLFACRHLKVHEKLVNLALAYRA